MDTLLQGIRSDPLPSTSLDDNDNNHTNKTKTRILCLESPTGTGKSLSLACACLAWLEYQQQLELELEQQQVQQTTIIGSSPANPTSQTGLDWLDAWQPPPPSHDNDDNNSTNNNHNQNHKSNKNINDREKQLFETLERLRISYQGLPNALQRRHNLVRQAITKEKMQSKQKQRQRKNMQRRKLTQKPSSSIRLSYEDDDDDDDNDQNDKQDSFRRSKTVPGTPEWLLEQPYSSTSSSSSSLSSSSSTPNSTNTLPPPPPRRRRGRRRRRQIVYAARTHSQLSQFVSEVRKTKWGKSTRVVALGSRSQGLCSYLAPPASSAATNPTSTTSMATTTTATSTTTTTTTTTTTPWNDASLDEQCLELRQSKKRPTAGGGGSTTKCGCPHYHAPSIATLALHSLTEPTDLEELAKLGQSSHTCAYYAARTALPHADLVVVPYSLLVSDKTRESVGLTLDDQTLVVIDEAHNLPQAIAQLQSCKVSLATCVLAKHQVDAYTKSYLDKLNPRHLQLLGQLKLFVQGLIQAMTKQSSGTITNNNNISNSSHGYKNDSSNKVLYSPSEFLCNHHLETLNLFPLLRYTKDSKLSQKLLGFLPQDDDGDDDKGEKENNNDNTKGNKQMKKKKKTVLVSPMSHVETLLEKLEHDNADGKLVVSHDEIRYCVLNPAIQQRAALFTQPHAVCLVGGTLQPLPVLIQELVPRYTAMAHQAQHRFSNTAFSSSSPSSSLPSRMDGSGKDDFSSSSLSYSNNEFHAFCCDHVVSSDNVLLQALTRVDSNVIDVRHKTRSTSSVCIAIGTAVLELCRTVKRGGIVVFLPSYKYEQVLIDYWKSSGLWKRLRALQPNMFREPKQANQIDATLQQYGKACSGGGSALLFSVMGGKLSEGINFANDLCRCVAVVGLPFADRSDPLLQEKLNLVDDPQEYYRSLCLRSVNQSVGRAIRHANDYAAVVLLDARYPNDDKIARGLPRWLTNSTPQWRHQSTELAPVLSRIGDFFRRMHQANKCDDESTN